MVSISENEKNPEEDGEVPIDNQQPQEIKPSSPPPIIPPQEGVFPAKGRYVQIEGKDFLALPLDVYRFIICVPYGGKHVEKMLSTGMTRVPRPHVDTPDDWSLDTDIFFEGRPLGPFKRLEIILDRDADDRLPKIKLELIG